MCLEAAGKPHKAVTAYEQAVAVFREAGDKDHEHEALESLNALGPHSLPDHVT